MTAPQDNPTGAGKTAKPDISSDEVDALLDGEKAAAPDGTPRPYDLIAHDKIVRGRLPATDLYHIMSWISAGAANRSDL